MFTQIWNSRIRFRFGARDTSPHWFFLNLELQKYRRTEFGQETFEIFIFKVRHCHEKSWTKKNHLFIASILDRIIKYFLMGLRQSFSSEKVRSGFFPEKSCLEMTSLREKFPNMELFLVFIFPYLDWIRRFIP